MMLVLGGGFGQYGHVAALASAGHPVLTLARSRTAFEARPELAHLRHSVTWCEDDDRGIEAADGIVLARRPADNATIALKLADRGWSGPMVIEKPVAESAAKAEALATRLDARHCAFSGPYLFLYSDWFRSLRARMSASDRATARVTWRVRQSPGVRDWKRDAESGGGPLAYYFIHYIAVLEATIPGATWELAVEPRGRCGRTLRASATAERAHLILEFTMDAEDVQFDVVVDDEVLARTDSPFGPTPAYGEADPRIAPLRRFYAETVFGPNRQTMSFHAGVHRLWQAFEKVLRAS